MKVDQQTLEKAIQKVSSNIDESYKSALFSSGCLKILESFFQKEDATTLKAFGNYCSDQDVPYLELTFFVEDLFQILDIESQNFLDLLAEGYLQSKLSNNTKSLKLELDKIFIFSIDQQRKIINAHLQWLLDFIDSVKEGSDLPEMDHTQCVLGTWIDTNSQQIDLKEIKTKHRNLHTLAKHAYDLYQNGQFHRFLLLYIDIVYYSSTMRQNLLQYFTQEELVSISVDALTHLPNRFALLHDIQTLDEQTSFFLFNIKGFSKINLMFGQDTGDKVIQSIAKLLQECKDFKQVYRIYGDEFGVLLPTKNVYKRILKLIDTLEKMPHPKDSNLVNISVYGAYAKVSEHLLEKTEFGVMHGRQNSNKVTNVDTITHDEILEYASNLELSQRLQLAFADNRIYPHYQPILNIETGKIEKYEVLLRVQELNGDILYPAQFLDILKNMYIYPEITKAVILQAFEKFKNEPYKLSINLSYRDIINEHTTSIINNILKDNPEIANRTTFELLEYEAILNFEKVQQFFSKIKNYGVKIALDDFGAGYSNFINIFKLEIDYIKIDGSIIQDVLDDKKSKVLITSIQNIADEIGAKTIAEFVSSEKIFEAVKLLGVNYAQGYFIGLPKAELIQ